MKLITLIVALVLLSACSKREDVTHTATSSMTKDQALGLARMWAAFGDPDRSYCEVQPTGSMLPTIGSNCILLLERVKLADLRVGDIALYAKLDGSGTICHRVRAVRPAAVLFTGDNNDPTKPDGWIAADRLEWRVAAIIYAKR